MPELQDSKQITSKFGSLQWRDFVKGFLIAGLIPVIAVLYKLVDHWFNSSDPLIIDWKEVAKAAFYGFSAYITKNLFEKTKTIIVVEPPLKEEGEKSVKVEGVTDAKKE